MDKREVRILKRAGELDKNGRVYSPRALAEATKGANVGAEPGKHGMVTRLRFVGGEIQVTLHFPSGVTPEDIGVEMKGEIIRSKIVEDKKTGKSYQLVEEFKIDNLLLVDKAEAERREAAGPGKSEKWGPLYPPPNKLTEKEEGGMEPGAGKAEGAERESETVGGGVCDGVARTDAGEVAGVDGGAG